MPTPPIAPLTATERAELAAWLSAHVADLPPVVQVALQQHSALVEGLAGTRHRLSQVLTALRRAMGITPSSERRRRAAIHWGR